MTDSNRKTLKSREEKDKIAATDRTEIFSNESWEDGGGRGNGIELRKGEGRIVVRDQWKD